jgi:hypothetical protein
VRDLHQVVVDDVSQVRGRKAICPEQNQVTPGIPLAGCRLENVRWGTLETDLGCDVLARQCAAVTATTSRDVARM